MLEGKSGRFMERKERNSEGKTYACQIASFNSAMSYKIFTKKYTYQMLLSLKNLFKNDFFKAS
jgi:hypothetical protein